MISSKLDNYITITKPYDIAVHYSALLKKRDISDKFHSRVKRKLLIV
jgi:hypothetical protein